MICPRCATEMEMYRASWSGESVTIEIVFRCPRCGKRILVELIRIKRVGTAVVIDRLFTQQISSF